MRMQTIRIIPFDIGYSIPSEALEPLKGFFEKLDHETIAAVSSRNELEYIFEIRINRMLKLFLFPDGIGEFVLRDDDKTYSDYDSIDVKAILDERKDAHRSLLGGTHMMSPLISQYLTMFQSFKKAGPNEISSLRPVRTAPAYVMSLYFFDFLFSGLSDDQKTRIYNLLYTDNYYKTGRLIETQAAGEWKDLFEQSADTLSSTYVVSSWASYIVFSSELNTLYDGLLLYQINIQHLWLYTHVTSQMIGNMIKTVTSKNIRTTHIDKLYQELLTMKLSVYNYKGIISSTMHEREYRIYQHLMETSKLNVLIEEVDVKFQVLDTRMNWLLTEKRGKNEKRIELFLFVFALLEIFTIIKDFSLSYFCQYWWFFAASIVLLIYLFAIHYD